MSTNLVKCAEIFSTNSKSSSHGMKSKTEKAESVNISSSVPSAKEDNSTKMFKKMKNIFSINIQVLWKD